LVFGILYLPFFFAIAVLIDFYELYKIEFFRALITGMFNDTT
jgi:hypothetical protein